MKVVWHSFLAPRWVAPLLVLAAVALIPIALMLAFIAAGLALGFSVLRLFLSGPKEYDVRAEFDREGKARRISDGAVIDADFEVKSGKTNINRPVRQAQGPEGPEGPLEGQNAKDQKKDN